MTTSFPLGSFGLMMPIGSGYQRGGLSFSPEILTEQNYENYLTYFLLSNFFLYTNCSQHTICIWSDRTWVFQFSLEFSQIHIFTVIKVESSFES